MEKTYTISQISKLLGLTNDAIRFYEKKGLVHPTTSPKNANLVWASKLFNKKLTILLKIIAPIPNPKHNGIKNKIFFLKSLNNVAIALIVFWYNPKITNNTLPLKPGAIPPIPTINPFRKVIILFSSTYLNNNSHYIIA